MVGKFHLRCWFGRHDFEIDSRNSGRKFCARCGMKSLLLIGPGVYGDKWRAGGGTSYWQDISFPDEGFWGLRNRFRFWLFKTILPWRKPDA